jgi:hypothetical protein
MVQVWKPEFERPGRHFVYTSRYVKFFFELLDKTNDRASYGLLLRKLRKKPAEYFDHKDLWQEECVKYIKVFYSFMVMNAKADSGRCSVVLAPYQKLKRIQFSRP